MKKVLLALETPEPTIKLQQVKETEPIFLKKDGVLVGMISKETNGWIGRLGGSNLATGYHTERVDCIRKAVANGYQPYTA